MKQRLRDIVKGYGYPSVDSFIKIYHKTKADYANYAKQLKEWGDKYGMLYVEREFEKGQKSIMFDIANIQNR